MKASDALLVASSHTGTLAATGSRGNSGDNEDPILATTHLTRPHYSRGVFEKTLLLTLHGWMDPEPSLLAEHPSPRIGAPR
jgi:hypothetical protein